jgi:hypothetical protein
LLGEERTRKSRLMTKPKKEREELSEFKELLSVFPLMKSKNPELPNLKSEKPKNKPLLEKSKKEKKKYF